ncbi:MAG TPA: transposase [Gemmatimonadales bacterium]|nr:transposase [Gemmatimonadales bacterium]
MRRPPRQPRFFRLHPHEIDTGPDRDWTHLRQMSGDLLPRRRSWRLHHFAYSGPWIYFITFVTAERRPILAEYAVGRLRSLPIGDLLSDTWRRLAEHPPAADPLDHCVMPDHFHGIVRIRSDAPDSLCRVVNGLKGAVTRQARRRGLLGPDPLWARSFHDRVIRSESVLQEVQRYIADNPARWVQKLGR